MKAGELLAIVDAIRVNTETDNVKYAWINEVEGRVLCEIRKEDPSRLTPVISEDDELTVPIPYSKLYTLYILAMIALSGGDYNGYTRAISEFEEAFSEYARFCIRSR